MKRTGPIKRKTPLRAKSPMKKTARPTATPIRRSANGQPCQVRVPSICNGDSATTVLAHLNGGGMGSKQHDIHAAFACAACHWWVDGGYTIEGATRSTRDLVHLQGVIRTQRILINLGLVEVAA